MPFTPFHFGPGGVLHAAAPRHVSFLAFCAANVIIDVEPLYYVLTHQPPLHRFLHTYLGATVALAATVALFQVATHAGRLMRLPNWFAWQELTTRPVAIGAALGVYSHIMLDSLMHADIRPFAPFSDANPLLGLVSLGVLHQSCVVCGLAGIGLVVMRHFARRDSMMPRDRDAGPIDP